MPQLFSVDLPPFHYLVFIAVFIGAFMMKYRGMPLI
jgi:hypothetical protein